MRTLARIPYIESIYENQIFNTTLSYMCTYEVQIIFKISWSFLLDSTIHYYFCIFASP